MGTILVTGEVPSNPFAEKGIQFVTSATNDHDHGRQPRFPAGFGDVEYTMEIVFQCADTTIIGDVSGVNPGADRRNNWASNTAEPYTSSSWWFNMNFLVDGHNNADFSEGTFSLGIFNCSANVGYLRWLVGDGNVVDNGGDDNRATNGDLHGIQNSSGINVLDGNIHVVSVVRSWDGGSGSILSLYVDKIFQASEATTTRPDMAAEFWDSTFTASTPSFPANERFLCWGAEKQSATQTDFDFADFKGQIKSIAFFNGAKSAEDLQGPNDVVDTSHVDYAAHYALDEGIGNPVSEVDAITMTLTNEQGGGFWP